MDVTYRIDIERSAVKSLEHIAPVDRRRVVRAIRALADDPRPKGCTTLVGRGGCRIRIGNYRVIYKVHDDIRVVEIIKVGHRREIYR